MKTNIYNDLKVDYSDLTYIWGEYLNLPVDIVLDDCFACEYESTPLVLFFRNAYGHSGDFVPLYVNETNNWSYIRSISNIYPNDLEKIYDFIQTYKEELNNLSIEYININQFINLVNNNSLNENTLVSINEMCRLKPIHTGLIADIWIDNYGAGNTSHHSYSERLKFQNPKNNKNNKEWSEMILDTFEIVSAQKIEWTTSELELLKKYININRDMLHKAFIEHWSDNIVKERSIPIDGDGNPINKTKEEEDYKPIYSKGGYTLVKNKDNQFNLLKDNNELISDIWFMHIQSTNDCYVAITNDGNTTKFYY